MFQGYKDVFFYLVNLCHCGCSKAYYGFSYSIMILYHIQLGFWFPQMNPFMIHLLLSKCQIKKMVSNKVDPEPVIAIANYMLFHCLVYIVPLVWNYVRPNTWVPVSLPSSAAAAHWLFQFFLGWDSHFQVLNECVAKRSHLTASPIWDAFLKKFWTR